MTLVCVRSSSPLPLLQLQRKHKYFSPSCHLALLKQKTDLTTEDTFKRLNDEYVKHVLVAMSLDIQQYISSFLTSLKLFSLFRINTEANAKLANTTGCPDECQVA